MTAKKFRATDSMRASLLRKCAANRRFIDNFILVLWCECKEGQRTKSTRWEDWCDIELESYGSGFGAETDYDMRAAGKNYGSKTDAFANFTTPRKVFSRKQLEAVQSFIDTHSWETVTEARRQIADDLLNWCNTTALNHIAEIIGERGTDLRDFQ